MNKYNQRPRHGIIVFRTNATKIETIIVTEKRLMKGFPKGGHNEGETTINTAARELLEETGFCAGLDVNILKSDVIKEKNERRRVLVTYVLGDLCKEHNTFCYNPFELETVEWMDVEAALAVLIPRRQQVLKTALEKWTRLKMDAELEYVPSNIVHLETPDLRLYRSNWILKVLSYWFRNMRIASENYYYSCTDLIKQITFLNENSVNKFELLNIIQQNPQIYHLLPGTDIFTVQKTSLFRWINIDNPTSIPLCVHGVGKHTLKRIVKEGQGLDLYHNKKYFYFYTDDTKCRGTHRVYIDLIQAIFRGNIKFQRCVDDPTMIRTAGSKGTIPNCFLYFKE